VGLRGSLPSARTGAARTGRAPRRARHGRRPSAGAAARRRPGERLTPRR
jgi:hypothetical protein